MTLGFSVPIFFVLFREATEASMVVSVLITFTRNMFVDNQAVMRKRLNSLIWMGAIIGLLISLLIGAVFLIIWFKYANNLWQSAEAIWEGTFSLIASVLLTVTAFAFLQADSLTKRWTKKLHKKLGKKLQEIHDLGVTHEDDHHDASKLNGDLPNKEAEEEGDLVIPLNPAAVADNPVNSQETIDDEIAVDPSASASGTSVALQKQQARQSSPCVLISSNAPDIIAPIMDSRINNNDGTSTHSTDSNESFMDGLMKKMKRKLKSFFNKRRQLSKHEAMTTTAREDTEFTRKSDEHSMSDTATAVDSINAKNTSMSALFWIPFVTVLREGLEAVIFLGGVGVAADPGSIPLAGIAGIICGLVIGYIIYRTGNSMKLHTFFIVATIFLLFLAAGLLVKSVLALQAYTWIQRLGGTGDPDNLKNWDVKATIFYLDCCRPNGQNGYGWQFFNALVGWSNQGTYASVATYIAFWLLLAATLVVLKLRRRERKKRANDRAKRGEDIALTQVSLPITSTE